MDMKELIDLAIECGFDHAGAMDVSLMEFRTEVRDMCAADKCHLYNRSWGCPPAFGTLEESKAKAQKYSRGLLVQCTGELEDSFDIEGMMDIETRQKSAFKNLFAKLRNEFPNLLPMGTGGCTTCAKCTYPDEPCRFPDQLVHSMEAYGLVVSDECSKNGMKYYYGPNTMTYTACFLLD